MTTKADTKMQGRPILKDTGCKVGGHLFTWTYAGSAIYEAPPPWNATCNCGLYLLSEVSNDDED